MTARCRGLVLIYAPRTVEELRQKIWRHRTLSRERRHEGVVARSYWFAARPTGIRSPSPGDRAARRGVVVSYAHRFRSQRLSS